MRLAQLRDGNTRRVGRVDGDTVVLIDGFDSMQDLVAAGARGLEAARATRRPAQGLRLEALATPITARRNIFCCGWNYQEHFDERSDQTAQLPERPTLFTKATTTVADGRTRMTKFHIRCRTSWWSCSLSGWHCSPILTHPHSRQASRYIDGGRGAHRQRVDH